MRPLPQLCYPMPLRNPFGEVSCEQEQEQLQNDYEDYYFEHTPFNAACLEAQTYLVVGRRGCGKTSLTRYFTFQHRLRDARCIDVDEPTTYETVFARVAPVGLGRDVGLVAFEHLWTWVIWSLVFQAYRGDDPAIEAVCTFPEVRPPSEFVVDALMRLRDEARGGDPAELAEHKLRSEPVQRAIAATLELTRRVPVIIAIDSLEHYDVHDEIVMYMIAGLIQCASGLQSRHAKDGLHVKAFVTAEIFPHLQENVLANPLKHVRSPVYLNWRPKDLLRLVCWRFYNYLEVDMPKPDRVRGPVNWDRFGDVLDKVWTPYFGETINNGFGEPEPTFPYILRHTQMRPRQLVVMCNTIAKLAKEEGSFPRFTERQIVTAVQEAELELATEVLNSYSRIHKNASEIVGALVRTASRLRGNELDKRARRTAGSWAPGTYSPLAFRRLVSELGIVGRVRQLSDDKRVVTADFEYFSRGRLELQSDDECVIHPMFYHRLHTMLDGSWTIYPFPEHPELRTGSGS